MTIKKTNKFLSLLEIRDKMSYFHDKKISSRKKNILNYIWGGDKKVKKKHAKTGKFYKKKHTQEKHKKN